METTGRLRLFRSSVTPIDAESLAAAMLDGWAHAQLSQGFQQATVTRRSRSVQRLIDWSGRQPLALASGRGRGLLC